MQGSSQQQTHHQGQLAKDNLETLDPWLKISQILVNKLKWLITMC